MNNRIKQRRIELGMTQQELANRIGITTKWLSKLENGKVDPKLSLAYRISHHLECRIDDVFLGQ